jgi:hypothetical protein
MRADCFDKLSNRTIAKPKEESGSPTTNLAVPPRILSFGFAQDRQLALPILKPPSPCRPVSGLRSAADSADESGLLRQAQQPDYRKAEGRIWLTNHKPRSATTDSSLALPILKPPSPRCPVSGLRSAADSADESGLLRQAQKPDYRKAEGRIWLANHKSRSATTDSSLALRMTRRHCSLSHFSLFTFHCLLFTFHYSPPTPPPHRRPEHYPPVHPARAKQAATGWLPPTPNPQLRRLHQ